ncbi:thioesterase family protein [Cellulosimicrobium sp. CUA-896]|uniref:acyl-CoA thioesterase n=1 Tax=Cellulosimicrobium sp. CUA-896 TaxID=1517881 RepID=UPI000960FC15|nr:acyl-CoA thioesterase [Cellulosimicrobium sp. CUA-896]OLT54055.1 thioesterase [Cellulosimicrobium sp. CUA-896]
MTRQIQLLVASTMPRKAVPGRTVLDPSVTRMRVRPGDLDFYLHVNNGVYLQMMDVARSHFIADLGAVPLLQDKGWYPVVAASTMTYRRSLRLWDRFEITTRVLGWDERVVYLEQVFTRRGDLCARGLVAGRFLTRGSGERVPAPAVVGLLGGEAVSPTLPDDVAAWSRAVDVAHRDAPVTER